MDMSQRGFRSAFMLTVAALGFSFLNGCGFKLPPEVLMLTYASDPNTLNLINANDNMSTTFQRYVYESLAARKISDPKTWEPRLAESWEFDAENLEYTIHLRKGVKWHPITYPNGDTVSDVEFTSADIEFTYQAIFNPHTEAAVVRSYLAPPDEETGEPTKIVDVTIIDDYTVKVKWLKKYFQSDEYTLSIQPMPRHVYGLDGNRELISLDFNSREFGEAFNAHWANTTMCGTGPLMFGEWNKGVEVTLNRNPDYWGEPFNFKSVTYQYTSNQETSLRKGMQGDLDWFGFRSSDQFIAARDKEPVKNGDVKLIDFPRSGYRYMGYNQSKKIFRDKRVRQAMSYATPVEDIINDLYKGYATRVTGPFVPGSPFSDDELKPYPFDIDKAGQLMSEAGWEDTNGNGVRDKKIDGKTVEFTFDLMIYAGSPTYDSIAQLIQSNFKKIGIKVAIAPANWPLMLEKLNEKNFDATILGWSSDWKGDPYQIWHGDQADIPKSSNAISYRNEEVDDLIDELRETMVEEDQFPLYQKIHRLLYEDQPYTFLYSDNGLAGHSGRLEDVKTYEGLRPFYDMTEWKARNAPQPTP